jgi:hypothetical protein
VIHFVPGLLAALLIVILGWLVAWALRAIIRRVLAVAGFDRFVEYSGVSQALSKADVRARPSDLVAVGVFWLVFLSFVMAGLSALEIRVIDQLISGFFLYLPRFFAALLILLVGFLLGNFLSRAALLAAVNTGFTSPRVVAIVVKFLVAILAFAMALEQLEIATSIVLAAFVISFGSVMLGLAIAFGVGGKDVARRVLERQFRSRPGDEDEDENHFSHI